MIVELVFFARNEEIFKLLLSFVGESGGFVPFLPLNWSKQAFLNDIYFYTTIDWYNKGSAFVLLLS